MSDGESRESPNPCRGPNEALGLRPAEGVRRDTPEIHGSAPMLAARPWVHQEGGGAAAVRPAVMAPRGPAALERPAGVQGAHQTRLGGFGRRSGRRGWCGRQGPGCSRVDLVVSDGLCALAPDASTRVQGAHGEDFVVFEQPGTRPAGVQGAPSPRAGEQRPGCPRAAGARTREPPPPSGRSLGALTPPGGTLHRGGGPSPVWPGP